MSNLANPFTFDPNWLSEDMKKDIQYKQMSQFLTISELSDMQIRVQNQKPQDSDFLMRDLLFSGQLSEEKGKPNLYHYAKQHYKSYKTIDPGMRYKTCVKECKIKKYEFWKKVLYAHPRTNDIWKSKQIVDEVQNGYKLPTQVVFFGVTMVISHLLKLHLNRPKFQLTAVVMGYVMASSYSDYKRVLPDPEFERERQDIVNYCFTIDPKYNYLSSLLAKTFSHKK